MPLELPQVVAGRRRASGSGVSCPPRSSRRREPPRPPRAARCARSRPGRARSPRSARPGSRSCAPSRPACRSSSRDPRARPTRRSSHALAAAGDQQRKVAAHRPGVSRPSGAQPRQACGERIDAVARAAELVAVLGVVGLEPARSDAEDEAAVADVVDRARHVGVQIGVAVRVAGHERAEVGPARSRRPARRAAVMHSKFGPAGILAAPLWKK